jgi:hypothetical protein
VSYVCTVCHKLYRDPVEQTHPACIVDPSLRLQSNKLKKPFHPGNVALLERKFVWQDDTL